MAQRSIRQDNSPWLFGDPVWIQSVRGQVSAELVRIANPRGDDELGIEVSLLATQSVASIDDFITVCPSKSNQTLTIDVRASIVPRIVAAPSLLYFGEVDHQNSPLKRNLLIRRTDGKNLVLLAKKSSPKGIEVVVDEKYNGSCDRARFVVTLHPGKAKGYLNEGKLLSWLEGETEPVVVPLMISSSLKDG